MGGLVESDEALVGAKMKQTYSGSCHCGRVRFEIDADVDHVRVCDCSVCAKRGALIHRVDEADFRLLTPLEELTLYQWGSMTAEDYFCPVCGVLPFRKPSYPTEQERREGVEPFDGWSVNARCLDGVDLASIRRQPIYGSRI